MNTNDSQLYSLMELGLGGGSYQEFVDHYLEKYDEVQIDGFDFAEPGISYTFKQLVSSTNATTLPTYVSPESPGFESSLDEMAGLTGNIPTQKKFYKFNRTMLLERMKMLQMYGNAALTPEMQQVMMNLFDKGTDGLITAYYNSLTNQRQQIVSTGEFTIDAGNNPHGLKNIKIKFGIADNNFDKLTGEARWWTDAERTKEGKNADPIKYIQDRIKYIRRTKHYNGPLHLEMDIDVWRDLLRHSKVLLAVGHSLFPMVTDEATVAANVKYMTEDVIAQQFIRMAGISVKPIDSRAYVDKVDQENNDIVSEEIENFKHENISFVPDGNIGEIQGSRPLYLGYKPEDVALFNGGRLVLAQRAIPETHSIYIESEAVQLCVLNNPHGLFISTVMA